MLMMHCSLLYVWEGRSQICTNPADMLQLKAKQTSISLPNFLIDCGIVEGQHKAYL